MNEVDTRYHDIHWLCKYLDKSQATVYRFLKKKNGIPARRVGGTWHFIQEEIDRWVEEQRR